MRVVLDTCVLVSALRSRFGSSYAVIVAARGRRFTWLASTALFLEYEEVLKRAEQQAASGLSAEDVDAVLDVFTALIEPVSVHVRWRPQLDDPDDELVMDAAINGRADALVTHNVRDFQRQAAKFGVRTLRPGQFYREMFA